MHFLTSILFYIFFTIPKVCIGKRETIWYKIPFRLFLSMPYHRLRPQPNKKSKPPLFRLKWPSTTQGISKSQKLQKSRRKVGMIQVKKWVPMGKGITNLYRYVEVSRAIIYSGFNLLSEETIKVLKVISCGEFLLNGFNNKSI